MKISFLRTAFLLGGLAVVLGAFGAHALKEVLEPARLAIFETGVRYQYYHAIALALTGIVYPHLDAAKVNWAGRFFILGIICFSGSLFLLALRDLWGIAHWKWLGPITPIGGLFFILGWLMLFLASFKKGE